MWSCKKPGVEAMPAGGAAQGPNIKNLARTAGTQFRPNTHNYQVMTSGYADAKDNEMERIRLHVGAGLRDLLIQQPEIAAWIFEKAEDDPTADFKIVSSSTNFRERSSL